MEFRPKLEEKPLLGLQSKLSDESGVALILVLIMMMLLTIIGATLLTSSTTDLQIAGNYRNNEEAFYNADAAIEYAQIGNLGNGENIYTKIIPGVMNTYSSSLQIGNHTARYKVQYIGKGSPPAGSGNDDTFQANFFIAEASGSSANNSIVETESEIARVVPKTQSY